MKIHQFVHTLTYGDAISDEARSIQRLLRDEGFESEIYCVHSHGMFKGMLRDYRNFNEELEATPKDEEVAVILHYSLGSPLNALFLNNSRIRKVMIYHNLTPEKWFQSYNPRVTRDLESGQAEFPEIVRGTELCLADSSYNEKDLIAAGASRTLVLPLLVDLAKWSVPANPGIASAVRARGNANIVHVGRFAPNKCLEDIIRAFYFFHHKIDKKSHLWLVGSEVDTDLYSFELRNMVKDLRLHEAVTFPGSLADSEVKAIYENSALYLCMSEHEGFCVPLIEAMHFNIPVLAYDSSAIAETLGEGGMLVGRKSFAEIAELMNLMIHDQALRSKLQAQGRKRVENYSESQFRKNLKERLIAPLLSEPTRNRASA